MLRFRLTKINNFFSFVFVVYYNKGTHTRLIKIDYIVIVYCALSVLPVIV